MTCCLDFAIIILVFLRKELKNLISEEFESNLRKMIDGDKLVSGRPLVVGRPSKILSECGANPEQDITVTKKVIEKAMKPEERDSEGRMKGKTGHGLTEELIVLSVKELESPALIFKGRQTGSLLVITSITDQKERNIVVAIEFDRQEGFSRVNSIRSIYGRDNMDFFIGENMEKGNLLAANKEKADELLHSIGKSYPEENTFISFR